MGTFDTFADTPFQIRSEGQTITLAFKQGVPTATQGTVTWNIPIPGVDCNTATDGRMGAYAGIVILLSTTPLTEANVPVDGTLYTPDPTASYDLHSGDRIGGALVVGAIYECDLKGTDDLTTELVISNLEDGVAYYVAGYAVDCQNRYHSEGVRAYSDVYAGGGTASTPAIQPIFIGHTTDGSTPPVAPTDGTGLVPGVLYQFDLMYGTNYPKCNYDKIYRIGINGTDAQTYADLIDELNKQFALLENPIQSPVPPNTGRYFWDPVNKKLYEFDGTQLVLIPGVIVEATDPSVVTEGTYWHIPSTRELYIRVGSPAAGWDPVNVINYGDVNPQAMDCDDYWFNPLTSQGYVWNGSAWCEANTIVSDADPSCPPQSLCGTYWYDTVNLQLYGWNVDTKSWDEKTATFWPTPPNDLDDGTFWFNSTANTLNEWNGTAFVATDVVISATQPVGVPANGYWYNPTTEELKQFLGGSPNAYVDVPVLVWPTDPTDVSSCDLWWDSINDELSVWDNVNGMWVTTVGFVESATDPSLQPAIPAGTLWYSPAKHTVFKWDGVDWIVIDVVVNDYDPTQPEEGDAWFNPANNTWYIWFIPSAGAWNAIDPIDSEDDPTAIPNGAFWFNTTTNTLWVRQGISWIAVPYTTTSLAPSKGQIYFNTSDDKLYMWTGTKWVQTYGLFIAAMNAKQYCGASPLARQSQICLVTTKKGSGLNLKVLSPGATGTIGTGFADFGVENMVGPSAYDYPNEAQQVIVGSNVPGNAFLWSNLVQGYTIRTQIYGADGVSDKPSYMELGVGTDGTPDERRELMDTLRFMLGYPQVDVELTKDNLDRCVTFAIEQLRSRSSLGYKRGFFFLDVQSGQQKYVLSNKKIGYNKIVNIGAVYRFTSAFLSSAHGSGVYGQVVLQHLYNMGTYDLTSMHLVAQYIETMEMMFATRLTFHWDEPSRRLDLYNSFGYRERVLMDTTIERTEQEILKDRWSKNWIRQWALAEAKEMLGHVRSKFGSLPGAGGGISLNGSELLSQADTMKQALLSEIDDYIVNDAEDLGMGTQFLIG
jgi:hypothetical protein